MYQFSVSEGAAIETAVGRVIATDADMGENTDMSYLIKDEEGGELFKVSTDGDTQEAVITIKKVDRPRLRRVRADQTWVTHAFFLIKLFTIKIGLKSTCLNIFIHFLFKSHRNQMFHSFHSFSSVASRLREQALT